MAESTVPASSGDREGTRTAGPRFVPNVDIYETETELVFVADLPGVTQPDLSVEFEQGVLTVHGKVAGRADDAFVVREYETGDFHRAFQIDDDIDPAGIAAELAEGVLTVHLPKSRDARPRKIPVRPG